MEPRSDVEHETLRIDIELTDAELEQARQPTQAPRSLEPGSFGNNAKSEGRGYAVAMSLTEVLDDLLALEELASREEDPDRRRSIDDVRTHVARRDRGAKVSEAAEVLGLSQPTVRAWIESGLLTMVPGAKPVRVEILALAEIKRALDLIREQVDDRQLLAHVMRILRDLAALEGSDEGFADLRAGRVVPLGDDLRSEIDELRRREKKPRSKSR